MREEVGRWMEQAEKDAEDAKDVFEIKKYNNSSFLCQQASEKSLKALLLEKEQKLIKTHDLVLLAKRLGAPENIIKICRELTPVYVETRYPDAGRTEYTKEETEEDIRTMEEILKWVKKNL